KVGLSAPWPCGSELCRREALKGLDATHHHSGCWPRRPLCVLSGRPSFCSETSSNGLVEFASIPTRRNPDVKRDDTHPPPKCRRCRDQTTCQGRVPLRRPGEAGLPE